MPSGNITSDSKFRGLSYAYDANNRQTSAWGTGINQTSVYDCAGQRVQTTAGSATRTMVYDIFGQDVADYASGALERENIYRGGQLLATQEYSQTTTQNVTWTNAVGVSVSGNNLTKTAGDGWGTRALRPPRRSPQAMVMWNSPLLKPTHIESADLVMAIQINPQA